MYVAIQQLCKLVFTVRECYHYICDHGKMMVQLVMLSRLPPIYYRRQSGNDKTVSTIPKDLNIMIANSTALEDLTLLVDSECFNRYCTCAFIRSGHFSSNSTIVPATSEAL